MERVRGHWRAVAFVCLCAVLTSRILQYELTLHQGVLADDAYISLRHARHLTQGFGLNFNRGERIEGYTSFVYTVLSAAAFPLGFAPEAWVKFLGVLAAFGLLGVTFALGRKLFGTGPAFCLAVAIAFDPRVAVQATWGLESLFFAFMVTAVFLLLFAGYERLAFLWLALSAMTRMEALQFVAPIASYCFLARHLHPSAAKRGPWIKAVWPAALLFGVYYACRWFYYGYPLPNTFYAKVGDPAHAYARGVRYVWESFGYMGVRPAMGLALFGLVFGVVIALVRWRKKGVRPSWDQRDLQSATIVAATAMYVAYVVSVGGDHFQERFIYHVMPFILISIAAAGLPIASQLDVLLPIGRLGRPAPGLGPALLVLVAAVGLWRSPQRFGSGTGVQGWISLGQYLKERGPVGATLATSGAGAIPFYSDLETIDMLGLNDVHIAHLSVPSLGHGVAGHEKSDPAYVLSRKPTYVAEWLTSEGRPGLALGFFYDFYLHYQLIGLVRMDGGGVDRQRVLQVLPTATDSEVVALEEGRGIPRGAYPYGLYERNGRPGLETELSSSDFQSTLGGEALGARGAVAFAPKGHPPGFVVYGPYRRLPSGRYAGEMVVAWDRYNGVKPWMCRFDAFDGKAVLAAMPLDSRRGPTGVESVFFDFVISTELSGPMEFRLWCAGNADIAVRRVRITKIESLTPLSAKRPLPR